MKKLNIMKKNSPCTTTTVRESEVPPPGGGELLHLNSSSPGENPSPQSRMRGNRKKRKCTSTPELTRTADTATHTPVSFLDQEQEYSIPSVPCSNSFGPLTDLEVNESSPCPRESVEPNPEFKCCTCQEVLSPITDKDFYDRMFDLMCCLRRTCESESGSTSNAERRQIWKCKCPPHERFVCIDCVSAPDCSQWYSRTETWGSQTDRTTYSCWLSCNPSFNVISDFWFSSYLFLNLLNAHRIFILYSIYSKITIVFTYFVIMYNCIIMVSINIPQFEFEFGYLHMCSQIITAHTNRNYALLSTTLYRNSTACLYL